MFVFIYSDKICFVPGDKEDTIALCWSSGAGSQERRSVQHRRPRHGFRR